MAAENHELVTITPGRDEISVVHTAMTGPPQDDPSEPFELLETYHLVPLFSDFRGPRLILEKVNDPFSTTYGEVEEEYLHRVFSDAVIIANNYIHGGVASGYSLECRIITKRQIGTTTMGRARLRVMRVDHQIPRMSTIITDKKATIMPNGKIDAGYWVVIFNPYFRGHPFQVGDIFEVKGVDCVLQHADGINRGGIKDLAKFRSSLGHLDTSGKVMRCEITKSEPITVRGRAGLRGMAYVWLS